MSTNHARALGIGAAALLWTAFGAVDAQTIPSNVSQPINAATNALTGGQAVAPAQAPVGATTTQAVPTSAPQPANPLTNFLTGGQAVAPAQAPVPTYNSAPGYGGAANRILPQRVARPLNAATNALTGRQAVAPAQAPYGYAQPPAHNYASGYAGVAPQPAYAGYAQPQQGYATPQQTYAAPRQAYAPTYYQSGYGGYAQTGASPCGHRQGWNPLNRVVNATRPVAQPQGTGYPSYQGYAAPGYAPTYSYGYGAPR